MTSYSRNPYDEDDILVHNAREAVVQSRKCKPLSTSVVLSEGPLREANVDGGCSTTYTLQVTDLHYHGLYFKRKRYDDMLFAQFPCDRVHGARRISLFVGQVSLELLRDNGRRVKALINWAAGYGIVQGDLDLHEKAPAAAFHSHSTSSTTGGYQHHNHTGCATISVLTTPAIAARVIKMVNEKAYTLDEDSVWLCDREDVDKRIIPELQRIVGDGKRQIRGQRIVLQYSKKRKGGGGH